MTFADDLMRHAAARPGKVFLAWEGDVFTYGAAAREVEAIAARLSRYPVHGQTLAIRLASPPAQFLWFLAAELAGAVPVLVHEYLKPAEVAALMAERPLAALVSDTRFTGFAWEPCGPYEIALCKDAPKANGIGVLTSGTSGLPKVLFRSDASWRDFFPVQDRIFAIDETARFFFQGSLAFTGNLNMAMAFLYEGASLYGTGKLFPRNWMADIRTNAMSHVYMIPSKLSALVKAAGTAESVRYILTGSQLVTGKLLTALETHFPKAEVILYYGASELSYISYSTGEDIRQHPDSVGRPFPGIGVSIRDGDIYVDTPYAVEGLSRPATCHDLGALDGEGNLHFLGRREDLYHVKGNHVARQKILSHLLMVPGVEEADIVPMKQENGDDLLTAFITGDTGLTSAALVRALEGHLNPWEIPRRFYFVPRLPKTSTGKVERRRLAEIVSDVSTPLDMTISGNRHPERSRGI